MPHRFEPEAYPPPAPASREVREFPFRAYKRAIPGLVDLGGRWKLVLRGHFMGGFYEPSASAAVCLLNAKHTPPDPSCPCGFYALSSYPDIATLRFSGARATPSVISSAVLVVDLHGTVVEGTRGFRASHQTVAEIQLDRFCVFCERPASFLGILDDLKLNSPDDDTMVAPLVSLCRRHTFRSSTVFTLESIAELAAVPVVWGRHAPLPHVSVPLLRPAVLPRWAYHVTQRLPWVHPWKLVRRQRVLTALAAVAALAALFVL